MEPKLGEVGDGLVSRWLSSLVVVIYVLAAFGWGGARTGISMMIFCVTAWFCIWFPEAMGRLGAGGIGREAVDTPPTLVWFIGWGLLLIPMIVALLIWMQSPL